MAYRVKKAFQHLPELTTVIDGKRVALNQSYVHTTTATAEHPPKTISVPLATQAQMKEIFERGDPCIEQYHEEKPATSAKKTESEPVKIEIEVKENEP